MRIENNYSGIIPDLHQLNQAYWFRLILTDEEDETTEIRYKITVSFMEHRAPDQVFLRIDRSDVFINDRAPDLPVDRLAHETGQVFYPLVLSVDSWMNRPGIANREQIAGRWEKMLPGWERYFQGEEAGRYLNRMGEVLHSPSKPDEIFRKELFIQIYFFILYAEYPSFSEGYERIALPVSDYGQVSYDVKGRLLTPGNAGMKEIVLEGTEVGKDENTYTANFKLDARTNIIREVTAEWHFRSPVRRKVRMILFPVRQPASTVLLDSEENGQEKKKSKGFFARLFGE